MQERFTKSWIFIFTTIRFFVSGVEEYIIMPTVWLYIRSLGGSKIFLGVVISIYSIAALIFAAVFGALSDKFRRPKALLIICHLARLSGNAIYSIPVSKYYPLLGRFLCGMSAASDGVLYGEVVRITGQGNERAKAFLFLEGVYTLGAAFGPILASFLTFKLDIFGWQINEGNSPGFVMAIVWINIVILTFWLPSNFEEDRHCCPLFVDQNDNNTISEKKNMATNLLSYHRRIKISCLLYLIFLTWFLTSVVTFYTPMLAMELFHLQQLHVTLLFGNGTLCLIVFYIALYIAADYFDERNLLVITVFLQVIPIIVLFIFSLFWRSVPQELSYLLIIYICFGISYSSYSVACSLLSKIADRDKASFYQGLSITFLHVAGIAGRIIPSFIFSKIALILFALGLGFLWALGLCCFCFL